MPKPDGLSLRLVDENGRLARAITHGDGTSGDDVTPAGSSAARRRPQLVPVRLFCAPLWTKSFASPIRSRRAATRPVASVVANGVAWSLD